MVLVFFGMMSYAFSQQLEEINLSAKMNFPGTAVSVRNLMKVKNEIWFINGSAYSNFDLIWTRGVVRLKNDSAQVYSDFTHSSNQGDTVYRLVFWKSGIRALTSKGMFSFHDTAFDYDDYWVDRSFGMYDLIQYGEYDCFASNKGLRVVKNNVVKDFSYLNGIPGNRVYQIIALDNRIYGVTDTALFYLDLHTDKIHLVKGFSRYKPELAIVKYQEYIILKSRIPEKTTLGVLAVKGDSIYDLKQLFSKCDMETERFSYIYEFTGNSDIILYMDRNNYSIIGIINGNKIHEYYAPYSPQMSNITLNSADEFMYVNYYNSNTYLKIWNLDKIEEIQSNNGIKRKLAVNNQHFVVGTANFNSETSFYANRFKDKGCNSTLVSRSIWIGGKDTNENLHVAATTYLQRGNDFFNGPLHTNGKPFSKTKFDFKRNWHMSQAQIRQHLEEFHKYGKVIHLDPEITDWPVYAVEANDTAFMAKFEDANKNGFYDPENGDYPLIPGDEARFVVFHDSGIHSETQGKYLGVQVNCLVWASHCPAWNQNDTFNALENTVFVDYEIINKGNQDYHEVYLGSWNDMEIGFFGDDYVGCIPKHNTAFGYNGDNYDGGENGFGSNPPVQNIIYLQGPVADSDGLDNDNNGVTDNPGEQCLLSHFLVYTNDNDPNRGYPEVDFEFYNYMKCRWLRDSAIIYNGDSVHWMYSNGDDPDHPTWNWNMGNGANLPGDRSIVSGSGPFDFKSGQTIHQTLAYHGMFENYQADPASQVKHAADVIREAYKNQSWNSCQAAWLGVKEVQKYQGLELYPVPAENMLNVKTKIIKDKADIFIYDAQGRLCLSFLKQRFAEDIVTISLTGLPNGIYWLKVNALNGPFSKSFIHQ